MSMIGNYRRLSNSELTELLSDPTKVSDFLYDEQPEAKFHLDIDKSWQAIHFLLNNDPWEGHGALFDAVLGGEVLGDQDVGYGPARFLTPTDVKAVADALAEISAADLLKKFDPSEFNKRDIYPPGWTGNQVELQYLGGNYTRLANFFQLAATNGEAMLLYLN
jgi:hypothetical protein